MFLRQLQDIISMVNTNVTAVALLTKNFAPGMVARNRSTLQLDVPVDKDVVNATCVSVCSSRQAIALCRGHIINISSIAAHFTYPGGSIYCGTKSFIEAC